MVKLWRGEVHLVRLNPTVGSEVRKTRPCVIISPDEIHQNYHTCLIAPLTSTLKEVAFRIPVVFQKRKGEIMLDQIRTVDKQRLIKRMGKLKSSELTLVLERLREMFEESDVH